LINLSPFTLTANHSFLTALRLHDLSTSSSHSLSLSAIGHIIATDALANHEINQSMMHIAAMSRFLTSFGSPCQEIFERPILESVALHRAYQLSILQSHRQTYFNNLNTPMLYRYILSGKVIQDPSLIPPCKRRNLLLMLLSQMSCDNTSTDPSLSRIPLMVPYNMWLQLDLTIASRNIF
jgi:hypothetical protein